MTDTHPNCWRNDLFKCPYTKFVSIDYVQLEWSVAVGRNPVNFTKYCDHKIFRIHLKNEL
ncbi:7908_t:CDS:2, partial [Scutellospora calospora]